MYEKDMKDMEIVDSEEYDLLSYYKKIKGKEERNWGGYQFNKTEVSKEVFDKAIRSKKNKLILELNTIPEPFKDKYIRIVTSITKYTDEFKEVYTELMKEGRRFKKKLEDIRVTYWFDN